MIIFHAGVAVVTLVAESIVKGNQSRTLFIHAKIQDLLSTSTVTKRHSVLK